MPLHAVTPLDVDFAGLCGHYLGGAIMTTRAAFRADRGRHVARSIHGDPGGRFRTAHYGNHGLVPADGCMWVDDGIVLADGMVLAGHRALCSHSLMHPADVFPRKTSLPWRAASGVFLIETPRQAMRMSGTTASIVSDGWRTYGHWLVDVLPRLARAMRYDHLIDRYLFAGPLVGWQEDLLEVYGIDRRRVVAVDLTAYEVRCDRLLVPTYDRYDHEISERFAICHDRVADRAGLPAQDGRRIFISRRQTGSRYMANRDAIEALATTLGYKILNPIRMPFRDQIHLFAGASVIAGECGSGLHNSVFRRGEATVVVLQSMDNVNYLQSQICQVRGHDIIYGIGRARGDGLFEIDPEIAAEALAAA